MCMCVCTCVRTCVCVCVCVRERERERERERVCSEDENAPFHRFSKTSNFGTSRTLFPRVLCAAWWTRRTDCTFNGDRPLNEAPDL